MIAHAVHPALVLHVPARARTLRPGWVRTVTPVEVAEISTRETVPVALPGLRTSRDVHPGPLCLHDGRLWAPIVAAGRAASAADLVALLEDLPAPGAAGPEGESFRAGLVAAFVDTPLYLPYRGTPRDVTRWDADDRGGALGPSRVVRRDAGKEAADNLRAFAREDLLVVGGVAHLRVVPLARPHRLWSGRDAGGATWEVAYHVMSYAGMAGLATGPVDPRGLEGARSAYLARHGGGPLRHPEAGGDWRALPDSVFGERAAEAVANNLPGILRRELDRHERRFPHQRESRDPTLASRLAALETEGLNRSWRGPRAAECLRACEAVLEPLAAEVRGTPLTAVEDGFVTALETLRRVHLPRYAPPEPEIEPEDVAAFAGL